MAAPFLVLASCLLAANPASAYYRPRNARRHRTVSVSTAAVSAVALDRLKPGAWEQSVAQAVDVAVQVYGAGSADFDPQRPPVAVLPVDGALVEGDPGELVFQDLVRKAAFKFDDSFWEAVPITYGRQRIREAYKQFSSLDPRIWEAQPTYHQYVKYFIESYQRMCFQVSRKDCRIYLTRLLRGFGRQEAIDYARGVLAEEARRPPEVEKLGESPEDPNPVAIHHGFRARPEFLDLAQLLSRRGFEVWLCDPEPQPVLEAAAAQLGPDSVKLAGIRQDRGTENVKEKATERLTGEVREPVPLRGGKVDAIVSGTGRTPVLVLGVSEDDLELLSYGNGLRIVVGSSAALMGPAKERHWRVQPSFK